MTVQEHACLKMGFWRWFFGDAIWVYTGAACPYCGRVMG